MPDLRFTLLAARGKDLPVHGDGGSVRSYLYVEDVAEAFDCVLHKGTTGECAVLIFRSPVGMEGRVAGASGTAKRLDCLLRKGQVEARRRQEAYASLLRRAWRGRAAQHVAGSPQRGCDRAEWRVDACVLAQRAGEVYNIGTEKERTVLDVASDVAKYFKLPQDKVVHVKDRAFNDRRCARVWAFGSLGRG